MPTRFAADALAPLWRLHSIQGAAPRKDYTLVGFMAYMLSIHPWLTLACLATTPLMWIVTAVFSRMVRPIRPC